MGEVPLRPYFPHPLALCCDYPVLKCPSASIVVTSTVRVKVYHDSFRVYDTQLLMSFVLCFMPPLTFPVFHYSLLIFWDQIQLNSYSASHDNGCTAILWNRIMTGQCEGMGEVGSARYEPALLPPCPSIRVTVRDPPNHTSSLRVKQKYYTNKVQPDLQPTGVRTQDLPIITVHFMSLKRLL